MRDIVGIIGLGDGGLLGSATAAASSTVAGGGARGLEVDLGLTTLDFTTTLSSSSLLGPRSERSDSVISGGGGVGRKKESQ